MHPDFASAQFSTNRADDFRSVQEQADQMVRQGIEASIAQEGQNYYIEIGGVRLTLPQAKYYAKRIGSNGRG